MPKPTRTIEIPAGTGCLRENQKPCILAAYATHMDAYNCKLYGRLLKGGQRPMKCAECLSSDANENIRQLIEKMTVPADEAAQAKERA